MVRTLQTFGVLAFISICVVSVLFIARQLQGAPETEQNPGLTIIEKFNHANAHREKDSHQTTPPLVRQAEVFASYLNPPEPPKPKEASNPEHGLKGMASTPKPERPKPKFNLIATCHYRSRPEKSMALISKPGNEPHWVKQGMRLGNFFVIEKVGKGMIVYRHGDQLHEMAIDINTPVQIANVRHATVASNQTELSNPNPANPNEPVTISP